MKSKMMKRVLASILTGVLMGSMLVGCGSSASSDTSSADSTASDASASTTAADGAVDLSFYIWNDEENYITKVVDAYNASQDKIHVTLTVIPSDSYDDKLKVMLAGQSDVDLVDIRGISQTTTYSAGGALLDITDRIESSGLDTSKYGDMWEASAYNGKYYALPTRTTCWALFYNADMIKEAGMEAPGQMTWSEYKEYADKLQAFYDGKTAEDGTPIKAGYWVPWIYIFDSVQHGSYANDEDTTYLQESIEVLKGLYKDGSHYSYEDVSSGTYDYISEFENEHVALLPNGEWCVNMIMQAKEEGKTDVNWEVAPMPIPDEGVEAGTSWGQFQYAAITSTSKHPDEAFDFLKYLCGEEGSEIYASTGMIHAYSSDEAADELKKASGKDSVQVLFDAKKVQEAPNSEGYDQFLNAFNEQAQLYFLDEQDIDTTMANFKSQADSLREQGLK